MLSCKEREHNVSRRDWSSALNSVDMSRKMRSGKYPSILAAWRLWLGDLAKDSFRRVMEAKFRLLCTKE